MANQSLLVKIINFYFPPLIYSNELQNGIGPVNIIRYVGKEEEFLNTVDFIVRLNNLLKENKKYKKRIKNLKKFISIGYSNEVYIEPKQSIFFEYHSIGIFNFKNLLMILFH